MKTYKIESERLVVEFIDYGAAIKSIKYKDKDKKEITACLYYSTDDYYINDRNYIGKTVGRIANRISNSVFNLGGKDYYLSKNLGNNHLHGGFKGVSEKIWQLNYLQANEISFHTSSYHLEEGYPGNIEIVVTYKIINENTLIILYKAKTDTDTPLSLTNHVYFNLNGDNSYNIFNHSLKVNSDKIIYTNNDQLPTGEIIDINNSNLDFRQYKNLEKTNLLDHYWIFAENRDSKVMLKSDLTNLELSIDSNYPGVQIYTGNFLNPNNNELLDYSGIAIECHEYPDFVNHSNFPQSIITKDEGFERYISFKFEKNG